MDVGIYAWAMLTNAKTGRFHPILFYPSPRPSESYLGSGPMRWRSKGHHTEGFDTQEQAQADIDAAMERMKDKYSMRDTGTLWEWDGEDIPAMTLYMPLHEKPTPQPLDAVG